MASKTKHSASIAPNNSPHASGGGGGGGGSGGHGGGGFSAPGSHKHKAVPSKDGRVEAHRAYPTPVRGGGTVGTGNSQNDSPAGKPTAHPMSRKPQSA